MSMMWVASLGFCINSLHAIPSSLAVCLDRVLQQAWLQISDAYYQRLEAEAAFGVLGIGGYARSRAICQSSLLFLKRGYNKRLEWWWSNTRRNLLAQSLPSLVPEESTKRVTDAMVDVGGEGSWIFDRGAPLVMNNHTIVSPNASVADYVPYGSNAAVLYSQLLEDP